MCILKSEHISAFENLLQPNRAWKKIWKISSGNDWFFLILWQWASNTVRKVDLNDTLGRMKVDWISHTFHSHFLRCDESRAERKLPKWHVKQKWERFLRNPSLERPNYPYINLSATVHLTHTHTFNCNNLRVASHAKCFNIQLMFEYMFEWLWHLNLLYEYISIDDDDAVTSHLNGNQVAHSYSSEVFWGANISIQKWCFHLLQMPRNKKD